MIRQVANYFSTVPAVFIDGLTYVLIAFFGAWSANFATEEATKYVSPQALFWIRSICSSFAAGLLSLKMFRSTAFADHQQNKADALKQTPQQTVVGYTPK